MGTLGFRQEDKAAIWRVLAALLHLSNVRFEVGDVCSHFGRLQRKTTRELVIPYINKYFALPLYDVRQENEARAHGEAKATASMWNSGLSSGESSDISSGHRGTSLASAAGMLGLDEETLTRKVGKFGLAHGKLMSCSAQTRRLYLAPIETRPFERGVNGFLGALIVGSLARC